MIESIKNGKLPLILGAVLFLVDSLIAMFGLVGHFFVIVAFLLSIAMLVLAFFAHRHIAVDIVYLVLGVITFACIAYVATMFEGSGDLRPVALTVGILCYIEGALSILGAVLTILHIRNGGGSYHSSGSVGSFFRKVGRAIGGFFASIGSGIAGLFTRRRRSSSHYGYRRRSRRDSRLKELFESTLFRTLFATFLAVGSIVYCAVSLSLHFVSMDILTGVPIALVLATVGNLLLTLKNEYLFDVDEDEAVWKNILVLLLVIFYHVLFVAATLIPFFVFGYYDQAEGESLSPFVAAVNVAYCIIAIAQPFIYNRLEDDDNEWLTVFGFPLFYAALYLVNMGICCIDAFAVKSDDMIVTRIFLGVAGGAALIFGIIRVILCIKNIVVSAGHSVAHRLNPTAEEQRQIELEFKRMERKQHPEYFKCAKMFESQFSDVAREIIKTPVDVMVYANDNQNYGSDYNNLKVSVKVSVTRHLPSGLTAARKKEIRQEYYKRLYEHFRAITPDITAEAGYTGSVDFDLTIK